MMRLRDKIAIVTGASTGIGRAVSVALAHEGATVYLVARSIDRLNETKRLIESMNGNAEVLEADLSDLTSLNTLINRIKSKIERVDIIANIAGIWHGKDEVFANKDFETFDQEIILDTYMVGLTAPTLLVHALIPLMPRNSKIITLSGTFEDGAKGWLPYYVSKKGIEDLTIGLSEELKDKDIQVNGISPADTATDAYKHYFPQYIPEAIEPIEIAKQAMFLASDEANNITGKIFVMKKGKEPFDGFHR
jgi:3-oxoacyl-[acyl-carrier protein] reductase